jgi:hypothetical protein
MLDYHDQVKKKRSRFCLNCSYITSYEEMGIGHVSVLRNQCSVQVSITHTRGRYGFSGCGCGVVEPNTYHTRSKP